MTHSTKILQQLILLQIFLFFLASQAFAQVSPPESLTAEPVSQTQINLTWKDNSRNKTYYVVERSEGNQNNWQEVAVLASNASSYSDRSLTANTTYFYRIKGVIRRIFGESFAYSEIVEAKTFPNPPAAPTDLAATVNSQTEITLAWKDNADNEDGYLLERSEKNAGNFVEIASLPANSTGFKDQELKSNTTYFYRVRAYNIGGYSQFSSNVPATTHQYQPTLNPIPDPPAIDENAGTQELVLTGISDGGDGGQKITVTATSDNKELIPDPQVVYKSPEATGTLRYRANSHRFGVAVITVTVKDDGPADGPVENFITRSFKVTVREINDPPTLDPIPNPPAIFENSNTQTIQLKGITAGPFEEQNLTVTATSSNTELIPHPTVNYTSPEKTGMLTFKPAENKTGKATITVTVKDDGPGDAPHQNTISRSFDVEVLWVNKAPTLNAIANPAHIEHPAGEQIVNLGGISPGPNDPQQKLTITATTDNPTLIQNISVDYTSPQPTGILKYSPVPGQLGTATITVTIKDDGPGSPPHQNTFAQSFEVEVIWINKAPTLDAIANPAPIHHTAGEQVVNLSGISPGPNDPQQALTITATTDNPALIQNISVEYTNPQPTGILKYSPVPDQTGTAVITVTIKDDGPGTPPHENSFSRRFTVRIYDIPLIASTNFPEYYTSASNDPVGITVHDNIIVDRVDLHYKPLNKPDWLKLENVPANGKTYNIPTPADEITGPIGMEYYFKVYANSSLEEETDMGLTYVKYGGDGIVMQQLTYGGTDADYQIVSVPLNLTNKTVPAVFEDDLGPYNNTQWRLFHFDGDSAVEYPSKFTTIEPGMGYWLIIRREKPVDTGEGTALKVSQDAPFEITLKRGWNQIGNPYNMDVLWSDVLSFNNNPAGVGKLKVFENGSFPESNVLKKLSGGFVFSEEDRKLKIPVLQNQSSSGRHLNPDLMVGNPGGLAWDLELDLKASNRILASGGLGMADNAHESKDAFDEIALPNFGFLKQAAIKFEHPEYFFPYFSKDVVATAENYVWEFTVEATGKDVLELSWPAKETGHSGNLMLYDIAENKVVDMKEQQKYRFESGSRNFRIYYGSDDFIRENLKPDYFSINKPFPNPFSESVNFPFNITEAESDAHLQIKIYDTTGKLVAIPCDQSYNAGFHEVKWDGNNLQGQKLPPGLYVFRYTFTNVKSIKEHTGRLIMK